MRMRFLRPASHSAVPQREKQGRKKHCTPAEAAEVRLNPASPHPPCCTICASCSPFFFARPRQKSVGTKQRVASAWNHVLWQVVKSVTTVAKLMGWLMPLRTRALRIRMGTCCIRG